MNHHDEFGEWRAKHVYLISEEDLPKLVGYVDKAGWYFSDECEQLRGNGPYTSPQAAYEGLKYYCENEL